MTKDLEVYGFEFQYKCYLPCSKRTKDKVYDARFM
jgi:hypothetical protein